MNLVSDDELWSKKGTLVASTLYFRNKAALAVDAAMIEMFSTGRDTSIQKCMTSTGREARVIVVVGDEEVRNADTLYKGD